MRFRLKKTLQIVVIITGLVFYINFVFISRNASSLSAEAETTQDQFHVEHERKLKQNFSPKTHNNDLSIDALRFHVLMEEPLHHASFQNESIYPSDKYYGNDRILEQLTFIPPSIRAHEKMEGDAKVPLKRIYLPGGIGGWAIKRGQQTFLQQKCPVPHCSIADKRQDMRTADVILFDGLIGANLQKPPGQIWLLYMLESPYHTPNLRKYGGKFNWTATYRHDSTIVAPYERFVPFNASVRTQPQTKNYAAGKSKMVAWFVSNCGARNNRMQYATQLGSYIEVDIYGRCGTKKCPRHQSEKCFEMLNKDYRFYLSFENSNCRDYITEKFFVNGLKHDVIPIVMGGAPEDYARAAPPHSYIHVDDFKSPKDLADYLKVLASNEKLYNEYFQWKGTGDIINTYFWCRVCALAHDVETRGDSWYDDVESWWRGRNVCIGQKSWRDVLGITFETSQQQHNVIAPLANWQPASSHRGNDGKKSAKDKDQNRNLPREQDLKFQVGSNAHQNVKQLPAGER